MFWFAGLVAPILLLFSLGLYYFFNQSFIATHKTHLSRQALQIVQQQGAILRSGHFDTKMLGQTAALLRQGEKILAQSTDFHSKDLRRFYKHSEDFFIKDHGEVLSLYYRYRFTQPSEGEVLLRRDGVNDEVENLTDTLLWLDPVLLLLLLIAAYNVAGKILRPIQITAKMAAQTSATHLPHPIPSPKYKDEIGELVTAFNTMVARLGEGIARIERFNSDVSHELRTPLTVIRGEIDLALRKKRDTQSLRRTLVTLQSEVSQLEALIHNLLLLSRYNTDTIRDDFEKVALDQLLLEALGHFDLSIKRKHLDIKIARISPIETRGNAILLRTLFVNLIDNAIKYTPEGKRITLSLYRGTQIHFQITDEGIGIAPDKLNKITERFYRADDARSRKIPGFGLGLALAKKIVELHGGTLQFDSKEGKGTRVRIVLGLPHK